MNDIKIMVAVPHTGHVEPMLYERLFMQEDECGKRLPNSMIELTHFEEGYCIDEKRNTMVKRFLSRRDCTHLLMLDSDVVMPLDAISQMLHADYDIVCGYYPKKGYPTLSCVIPQGCDMKTSMPIADISDNVSPFVVKANGMGCALMKRSVFERVREPWFKYVTFDDGNTLSEDYNFCLNCVAAGIEMYVHPRVRCGHVKKVVL